MTDEEREAAEGDGESIEDLEAPAESQAAVVGGARCADRTTNCVQWTGKQTCFETRA